jgi:hypothetical protein
LTECDDGRTVEVERLTWTRRGRRRKVS